jgi:hypothetical protein
MLKFIACLLMLIDHFGAALMPEVTILRMIGRLSFPIFAYLIAIGYSKTNSVFKYFCRLLMFGIISQLPFSLVFNKQTSMNSLYDFISFFIGSPIPHLNVFFTLAIGLLAIHVWDKGDSKTSKTIAVFALGIAAEAFYMDYGIYGVAMILAFYIYRYNKIKTILSQVVVYILFNMSQIFLYMYEIKGASINLVWFIQVLSLLALIFIFKYNGKKGKDIRYIFYAFYPVHLLVIGLIKILQ